MAGTFSRRCRQLAYLETCIHIHGRGLLRVENCRRILTCHEVLVRLRTRDMTVEIRGQRLRVYDYHDGSLLVTGHISGVSLGEEG